MKTASLSGSPRGGVGKKDATVLRDKGQVPGVMYGGSEQVHFHVSEVQLNKLVITPETYLLQFEIDGKTHDCVFQDVQFHPVTDRIVHIDLLQVATDKPIRVKLPVRTEGTSIGVQNGGSPSRGIPSPSCCWTCITSARQHHGQHHGSRAR